MNKLPVKSQAEVKNFFRDRAKGKCLYRHPDGMECKLSAIDSHSIQRLGALAHVSENSKVFHFESALEKGVPTGLWVKPKLVGLREASIFPGFCEKHDKIIFSEIEKDDVELSERNILLLAYRAICRELVGARALYENSHQAGLESNGAEDYYRQLYVNKVLYEKHFSGIEQGNLIWCHFEFDEPVPFCGTSCFTIDRTMSGKMLVVPQFFYLPLVSVFCGKLGQRNVFLAMGYSDRCGALVEFFEGFRRVDKGDFRAFALRFLLTFCENTYFNPTWFLARSESEREEMFSIFVSGSGLGDKRSTGQVMKELRIDTKMPVPSGDGTDS